ncbi:MAG TPA: lytic transglycosylase domain-containing protein, partial [Clostridia bacterium]
YNSIMWGIRSLNEKPTRRGYELAYPRGFEELVHEASEKYDLEPEFIWAVIREESHFRHDAVSGAGAIGLMQIMPPTGKDIASRLGLSITEEDLLNPELNIKFGSFYVRSMLNMFEQDMDKALAAYNGGAGNVKKWMTNSIGTLDEDFPTAIAFRETQEYITKVRNSYYIYKWLYE